MGETNTFHVGGVFDPETGEVSSAASITVRDGVVLSVGQSRQSDGFDFRHCIALPGLIDSHSHLSILTPGGEREQVAQPIEARTLRAAEYCQLMLQEGVTTIRGMGEPGWFDIVLREAFRQGLLNGPRIIPSGKIIAPTHADVSIVDDPADGEQVVVRARENLARGADWLKIYATPASALGDPTESHYSKEEIDLIAACARRANVPVAAHAHGGDAVDYCIAAGVRTIEHGRYLSPEQLEHMAAKEVALCSTVVINVHQQARLEGCTLQEALRASKQTVAEAIGAGVTVIPGSDAVHGSFRFELEALEFYGMSRLEALRAATVVAADVLGLDDAGQLQEGFAGDFALVDSDPISSESYPDVAATVVRGNVAWVCDAATSQPNGRGRASHAPLRVPAPAS